MLEDSPMRRSAIGPLVTVALSLLMALLVTDAQRLRALGYGEGHHLELAFCNAEGLAEKFVACAC